MKLTKPGQLRSFAAYPRCWADRDELMIAALEGRALTRIDGSAHPGDWLFYFQEDCFVRVGCDWRIVSDERIALASQDHEQMFGRSTPLDGVAAASKLLVGAKVVKASINPVGDIVIRFDNEARLETFTNSCAYESGAVRLPNGREILILGGGAVDEHRYR